jgi:hypothetical protein
VSTSVPTKSKISAGTTRAYSGRVIEHAQTPGGPTRRRAARLTVRKTTPGSLGSPLCVAVTNGGATIEAIEV